ncbi:PASTA domain-containing protein [Parasulfitobacter algicola]|uniref:PASTA domain-containing protein n=1 Tax=Parasulfitobacter algicola TaxID=2614809 RepID=A0ABX2IS66_9RHOB|nr:PASTA domain-containing protein [Sulfitobacter algicola]NSX55752.1 PASTA domain-containing protein [Sulfitobacter algicola]
MPEIVNITQSETKISVGSEQPEIISFDVVNVSERNLDVALQPVPAPGTNGTLPDWIRVLGDQQISLAPSETRKVEIEIAPEAGIEPSDILFCLKAFEPALPEENNDLSSVITATVSGGAVIPPKKTPWGLIAGIAAAVILLIGGGITAFFLLSGPGEMPNLTGKKIAEVQDIIDDLEYGSFEQKNVPLSTEFPESGMIIAQSPEAETELGEDVDIVLTVAGRIIPNVKGKSAREAMQSLIDAGINRGNITVNTPLVVGADGRVTQQAPAANSEFLPNAIVVLTVPKAAIKVPLVTNLSVEAAREKLRRAGFNDRMIRVSAPRRNGANGRVTEQTPAANEVVDRNTRISLVAPQKLRVTRSVPIPIPAQTCARSPFAGTWKNVDSNTRSVTRVVVTPICTNPSQVAKRYTIRMFGSCSPRDCDWGNTTATLSGNQLKAIYDQGFVKRQVFLTKSGSTMKSRITSNYTDSRPTRTSSEAFRK